MKKNQKRSKKKKFLVFSAHPDDLDFSSAGTVARLTKEGHFVEYCIITNGEKGIHKVKQTKKQMMATREKEQKAAAKAVGVDTVIFLRHTDGDLEHTKEVRCDITRVIRKQKPDIIIAHDPSNHRFDNFYRFHRDHRMAAEIIFDAIYPAVGSEAFFPELSKEHVLPHQIEEVWFYATDSPNLFFDISKTIDLKIAALRAHESQIKDHSLVEKMIKERARKIARNKKYKYAEGFRRLTF